MAETKEHAENLSSMAKTKAFLGREFLTWLWYTAETSKESLVLPSASGKDEHEFDLWIDDRIVLESAGGEALQNVMKGGDPSQSREAATSLATGKTVRELKLGMNIKGAGEFSAILHCDDLNPRSLKLPAPGKAEGPVAATELPLIARLRAMDTFLAVFDGLFAHFLATRVDPKWEAEGLKSMRKWIKVRHEGLESGTLH